MCDLWCRNWIRMCQLSSVSEPWRSFTTLWPSEDLKKWVVECVSKLVHHPITSPPSFLSTIIPWSSRPLPPSLPLTLPPFPHLACSGDNLVDSEGSPAAQPTSGSEAYLPWLSKGSHLRPGKLGPLVYSLYTSCGYDLFPMLCFGVVRGSGNLAISFLPSCSGAYSWGRCATNVSGVHVPRGLWFTSEVFLQSGWRSFECSLRMGRTSSTWRMILVMVVNKLLRFSMFHIYSQFISVTVVTWPKCKQLALAHWDVIDSHHLARVRLFP